ncbi:sensor histidine kinase [Peribacillus sp. FSL H8-0477]|uniref:sensor histidine kinase n=1 Tax=Peribacillus sp. FSL H8-0477 TaxID=2921388 RepID=UPI0030F51942
MKDKLSIKKMYREKLSRSLLLFAIIPTVLVTALFFQLFFSIGIYIGNHDLVNKNKELSDFLTKEIVSYKEDMRILQANPNLSSVFESKKMHTHTYEELYQIVANHHLKSNFYIVSRDGDVVLTNAYQNSAIKIYHKQYLASLHLKPKDEITIYKEKDTELLDYAFLKLTTPVYKGEEVVGFIIFDLQSTYLKRFFEESYYTDIVITDPFGNQLFTSKKSLILGSGKMMTFNEKEYNVATTDIVNDELRVHSIRYMGLINKLYIIGFLGLLVISILLIGITRLFANNAAKRKTKSIDTILSTISEVNEGTYKGYKKLEDNDELEYINYYLNEMIQYRDSLLSENKEILVRKTEAELKELQMQFNPHFLFNTLENIKFMIRLNPSSAEQLLLMLSSILRYSINNTEQNSPIKHDLLYIKDYLEIQKYRFEERLHYTIDLPVELEEYSIPKLITQPLVENAIKYGIDEVSELRITIKLSKTKKSLLIIIADTGIGFTAERLQKIRRLLQSSANHSNHIGIYNVHRRIQLKYGTSYGVRIFSEKGKGSLFLIKIPINKEDKA